MADFDAASSPEPVHGQPVLHEQRAEPARSEMRRNQATSRRKTGRTAGRGPCRRRAGSARERGAERARRRSTVREPAPMVFSGELMAPIPHSPVEAPQADRRAGRRRARTAIVRAARAGGASACSARAEMKSGWVDKRGASRRRPLCPRRHRPRSRVARLYDPPARPRSQARTARRRQHLGEDDDARSPRRGGRRALRQGLGLRTWRRSSRRACRRCGSHRLRKLRVARRARRTKTWCASSAPTSSIRSAPNPSVEMLLHAFMPHKFVDHTHANAVLSLVDQPDGEAICAEVYDGRMGIVPYIMPGFALAKKAAEVFERRARGRRADPAQARHLHLRRERARSLRAHDRDGVARRGAPARATAKRSSSPRNCRRRVAPVADSRADPARRLQPQGREDRGRVAPADPRFPQRSAILDFVNGAELRALQPGRRGDAGPHDPHQELAAGRGRARGRQARRLQARRARRGASLHRAATRPISRATTRASAASRRCSIRCRASCWCRASGCSASAARRRTPRVAADLAEAAIETITDAEAIGRFESISEADMFDMEYWSLEQAKLGAAAESRSPARSRSITGAGGAIGAATAKAFAAAGAEVALLDLDERCCAERSQGDRRHGARGRMRRDRRRLGAGGLRPGGRRHSAASTSWCRMRAPPGRAGSARSTRRCCARASS